VEGALLHVHSLHCSHVTSRTYSLLFLLKSCTFTFKLLRFR